MWFKQKENRLILTNGFQLSSSKLFFLHLTVLYLYVFCLNGVGKLHEGVFKHAELTLYNKLGTVMYFYLMTVLLEEWGL